MKILCIRENLRSVLPMIKAGARYLRDRFDQPGEGEIVWPNRISLTPGFNPVAGQASRPPNGFNGFAP